MLKKVLIKHIRKGLRTLSNPEIEFCELENSTLEDVVGYYMLLLVATSMAAGLANFLFFFIKAVYLDIFLNVNIRYGTLLNYLLSRSVLLIFLYIFIGTFILFLISIALKLFFPKIKYTNLLKILLPSLTPFLLFVWIPFSPFPLIIWSSFMFVTGIKNHKIVDIKKGSIKQRY